MFHAQRLHGFLRQAGIREHSALLQHERKISSGALLQLVDQLPAHRADAVAHFAEFVVPQCAQFRGSEHRGDDLPAMRGRARVVGARDTLDLRQHARGFLRIGGDDRQRADAFAVERKRLGKRTGDQHRSRRCGKAPDDAGVGLGAVAEALIREVEDRHQPAAADALDDRGPLRIGRIDACRIVAARMQNDDRTGRHRIDRIDHSREIEAVRACVVVPVLVDLEARVLEQGPMVFPARITDPHLRVRQQSPKEIGADLQRSGAAQCLHRDDPARAHRFIVGAEDQHLRRLVVRGDTVDRQVAARRRLAGHVPFHALHALEQRQLAGVVVVDADAEVDLARILVGNEGLGDAENRVARGHLDCAEDGRGQGCVHGDTIKGLPARYCTHVRRIPE